MAIAPFFVNVFLHILSVQRSLYILCKSRWENVPGLYEYVYVYPTICQRVCRETLLTFAALSDLPYLKFP